MTDEEALAAAEEAAATILYLDIRGENSFKRAIRAVWDLAVAHGREQAAQAIEAVGQSRGCDYVHMDWAAEELAHLARGGAS